MKNLGRDEDVAEIRGRIETLTAADERRWGLMSVGEMLCHVREAYVITIAGGEARMLKGPLPPKLLKVMALKLPLKWPKTIQTVPTLKRDAMPPPGEFEMEKVRLLEAFEAFARARENRAVHPMFGAMEPWDWMRWGYLHADHHLRQFGR